MNPIRPESIGSVSRQWAEAWSLPMYAMPETSFDDTVLARFDDPATELNVRMASSSGTAILSVALMAAVRGDIARCATIAGRLVGAVERVGAALRAAPGGFAQIGLETTLRLSLAAAITRPELPGREALQLPAQWAVRDLAGKKGAMHSLVERRLRLVAFGALLAQDVDLLRSVISLIPAPARMSSVHWALYDRIVAVAEPVSRDDGPGFRVTDERVRAGFEQVFAQHRLPVHDATAGSDGPVDAPMIVGNYLHCWAWLSLFSPQPVRQTDWHTMRELMTS